MNSNYNVKSFCPSLNKKLLIVGPLPPPIGGSSVTIKSIIEELEKYSTISVDLINTSPPSYQLKKIMNINLEKIRRMSHIIIQYIKKIGYCDAVLILANNFFITTIVIILLKIAKLFNRPMYIKPVGGDLDLYLLKKNKILKAYLLWVLRTADGLFLQTHHLKLFLMKLGCKNCHYIPGVRKLKHINIEKKGQSKSLRLIFLAHIMKEKGALDLLKALQILSKSNDINVSCDFYGPIYNDIENKFYDEVAITPNAQYCGIAEAGTGTILISNYDVMVLPTYFICEGHPGVIIEAMHAGVPVISTLHRAIPELITDGKNGFLVPVRDSYSLSKAIREIALDYQLRKHMGEENFHRGLNFSSNIIVNKLIKIIFSY
jgi:glycosyltransferase involved in cell wall biosynthesis